MLVRQEGDLNSLRLQDGIANNTRQYCLQLNVHYMEKLEATYVDLVCCLESEARTF